MREFGSFVQWECGCDGIRLTCGANLLLLACYTEGKPPFQLVLNAPHLRGAKWRVLGAGSRTALLDAINEVLARGTQRE